MRCATNGTYPVISVLEIVMGAFSSNTNKPFHTLLAGSVNIFSFWYEGKEKEGYMRQLTPLECESLMGLPEGWTAFGNKDEAISDYVRYKAIGNTIALPCAEYIFRNVYKKQLFKCDVLVTYHAFFNGYLENSMENNK